MSTPCSNDNFQQPIDGLADVLPTVQAPADHHWFVPDVTGSYCLACNLPLRNRRHARKAA